MTRLMRTHSFRLWLSASALCVMVAAGQPAAQTKITVDKNKYTPAQDVQIGQEAAAEVRKQLPLLDDGRVDDWVERVGRTPRRRRFPRSSPTPSSATRSRW